MKKVLSGIGIGLLILLLSPILIGIVLLALLGEAISSLHDFVMRKIRNDPKVKLEEIIPKRSKELKTINELRDYVEKAAERLAKKSGTKTGGINVDEGEWSNGNEQDSWRNYSVSCILKTKHAHATITTEVVEIIRKNNLREVFGEDEDHSPMELYAKVELLHDNTETDFYLEDPMAEWFLVQLLNGEYKINRKVKYSQIWAHLAGVQVWLVQYHASATNFGVRRDYSDRRARRYWIDTER